MRNNDAYTAGFKTGLQDFSLTGPPHRDSVCPFGKEKQVIDWWLGRVNGFQDAYKLLHPEPNAK